jgi:hypothetical protein
MNTKREEKETMPTITERIQALENFAEGVMLLAQECALLPPVDPPVRRKRRMKAEIAAAKGDGVTAAFNPPPEPPMNRPIPRRTA